MLEVAEISKKFGELTVLDNVSFDVEEGACLGIIGPNGAGKTTLFNIISGFIKPNKGEVKLNGKNLIGKKPSKIAKFGLIRTFQIVRVFKNMSVEENLEVVDADLNILMDFGLWEKRKEFASNLSHGEIRKLSIALSLSANPRILLLDEPFSGLSPAEAVDLAKIIKTLKGDGMTLMIIEHRLSELFGVTEDVLVLNSGKVICRGTPEEIVKNERVVHAYLGKRYSNNKGALCVL